MGLRLGLGDGASAGKGDGGGACKRASASADRDSGRDDGKGDGRGDGRGDGKGNGARETKAVEGDTRITRASGARAGIKTCPKQQHVATPAVQGPVRNKSRKAHSRGL